MTMSLSRTAILVSVTGATLTLVVLTAQHSAGINGTLASARSARAVLDEGLRAVGGEDHLRALESVTRSLRGSRSDRWQGVAPIAPFPDDRAVRTNSPAVWSFRGLHDQSAIETLEDVIVGGQPIRVRTVLSPKSLVQVFDEHGAGRARRFPEPMLPAIRARLFRRYPESLLLTAASRADTLRLLPDADFEGRSQRVISFADVDGTQTSLHFDTSTHLLTKAETLMDDPFLGDAASEFVFEDYRVVNRVKLPYRYRERLGGSLLQDLRVEDLRLNAAPDGALLGERPDLPTIDFPIVPDLKKLGDGVYLFRASYNSLFVVLADSVVAVEPGGSNSLSDMAIQMIKRVAPDKPIKYVVATHFHSDHVSGIRSYVAEGATIVTTPDARLSIETALNSQHELQPDRLSRQRREAHFEILDPAASRRVFTDGRSHLELHYVAPNAHSRQMIVAYVPALGVLFEADMLDIDIPGRTGAGGDDTASLLDTIERLLLAVNVLVPVHGVPGTMDDLRRSVETRGRR